MWNASERQLGQSWSLPERFYWRGGGGKIFIAKKIMYEESKTTGHTEVDRLGFAFLISSSVKYDNKPTTQLLFWTIQNMLIETLEWARFKKKKTCCFLSISYFCLLTIVKVHLCLFPSLAYFTSFSFSFFARGQSLFFGLMHGNLHECAYVCV